MTGVIDWFTQEDIFKAINYIKNSNKNLIIDDQTKDLINNNKNTSFQFNIIISQKYHLVDKVNNIYLYNINK